MLMLLLVVTLASLLQSINRECSPQLSHPMSSRDICMVDQAARFWGDALITHYTELTVHRSSNYAAGTPGRIQC